MQNIQKNCPVTNEAFAITPDDLAHYEKIDVPSPTFSPMERMRRRMAWRNERTLYKRTCDATGETVVSCYRPDAPFPVYKREYWYSDNWDPSAYQQEYDFSRSFFEQFKELLHKVPRAQVFLSNSTGSDYTNYTVESKNCYLCFTALGGNEDCSYSSYLTKSLGSYDCHLINQCENCYQCINCENCISVKYSIDSSNCSGSSFLYDCNGCVDCTGCVGLRNKQYYIFNEQYSKEEYAKKVAELDLACSSGIARMHETMQTFQLGFPKKYIHGRGNVDVSGDYIYNSKNCHDCYLVTNNEDCKFAFYSKDSKSMYDVFISFLGNEYVYESHATPRNNYMVKFCDLCANGNNTIEYCQSCESSSNLFGCIGLRGKEYCIFNKQYTKDEYEELIPKIKQHMMDMPYYDAMDIPYRYGEFFPIELSPFGYNETTAQDFFPLSKEEAGKRGYRYTDIEKYKGIYAPTISPDDLPERIDAITDEFLNHVIACTNAATKTCQGSSAFRLTQNEISFYKRNSIPLPHTCPNCRQFERISKRNGLKLYERITQDGKNVLTTFSPDQPEKILSEEGYQQEYM